jgi:hypothetical protein
MALQFSETVRNASANAIEPAIGAEPTLEIRTGAKPANTAAADTGTVVAVMTLPASFFAAASAGAVVLEGTWQDLEANNAADLSSANGGGYFRVKQGATTHIQGSVTEVGGGGDMTINNPVVAAGQRIDVTAFTVTMGGA